MGILRNFIDILGITPESELPDKVKGQLIEYSEIEHLYLPGDKPEVKNIYQISINVELKSTRTISAPLGKIVVLDGVKKIKIIYTDSSEKETAAIADIECPFNAFLDLPKEVLGLNHVNIYIADAYFKAIDPRKLYCFILFVIDAAYDKLPKYENKNRSSISIINAEGTETINSPDETFKEKEPSIRITSQALNEMLLSKITTNWDSDTNGSFVDIDSEYL